MLRLDFHTMIAIILHHMKSADLSQVDLMYSIFEAFIEDKHTDFAFDNGQVCHWINGRQRISPKIISFYIDKENQKSMKQDFINNLFPFISDLGNLASETKDLLIADCSISDFEKNRLLHLYDNKEVLNIADFMCSCFLFGISRNFVKTGKSTTSTSPVITDIILTTNIPAPVKDFIDRDAEVSTIADLLQQHGTLFITGSPGTGKSELAKQYAKCHKKEYINILYMEYTGNFYEMIAALDFIDDTDSLSEKERFKKHFRFLKTLQEDSLIIVDNFNATFSEESLLEQICSLRCHLLLTSRNYYDLHECYELESSKDVASALLKNVLSKSVPELMVSFENEIDTILETINYNLVATELIGRLLAYHTMTPDTLCQHLKENALLPKDTGTLTLTKDNHAVEAIFQAHMLQLLGYENLPKDEQLLLSFIALAPESGFPLNLLHKWCGNYSSHLDSLVQKGLINSNYGVAKLKPYIRSLTNAGRFLTTADCNHLLLIINNTIQTDDSELTLFALHIVDMIYRFVVREASTLWLSVVRTSLEANNRFHRYRSFAKLLGEYEYLCYTTNFDNTSDYYLLEHFKAIEAWNIHKNINNAISFEEKAIFLAGKHGTSNILNFSALYLDAGRYYHIQEKYSKSLEYTQKAYSILERASLQYSPNGISCLIQYARLLFDSQEYAQCLGIYNNCLAIVKNVYGVDALMTGYITQNIAALYHKIGNIKAALIMYHTAENILLKHLGDEHEDVILCREQASALDTTGDISLIDLPKIEHKFIA